MSNIIKVKEERNVLAFVGEVYDIVANSTNFYLQFEFDEEWLEGSIFTAIFDFDGQKQYVELDENYKCQIPATNSCKILFCVTTEPTSNQKLSSTILSLNVEPSGDTNLEDSENYKTSRNALLQIIEDLKTGNNIQASFAKTAGTSETQVSLTGDENIAGVKNFTGKLQIDSVDVPSAMDVSNPNFIFNSNFTLNTRNTGTYTRSGADMYTVDCWGLFNANGKFQKAKKTLTGLDETGPVIFCQWIESSNTLLLGKTISVSALVNNVRYSKTIDLPSTFSEDLIFNIHEEEGFTFRVYVKKANMRVGVQFLASNGVSVTLGEVKLEISKFPTKYQPRTLAEENNLCQRYFQRIKFNALGYGLSGRILFFVPTPTAFSPYGTFTYGYVPKIKKDGQEIAYESLTINKVYPNGFELLTEDGGFEEDAVYMLMNGVLYLDGGYY